MLPNHTTKKWQNTNSNPGLPALPRPDPKIDHCLNWCCAHIQMSLGGRGRESFYYSSMDGAHSDQCLHRHCQQELLDSCTISSSCSSLSVFKCGSLLLFSCLMGFLLLNPSDEADPAVLGIIPSDEWWPQDWRQLTSWMILSMSPKLPLSFSAILSSWSHVIFLDSVTSRPEKAAGAGSSKICIFFCSQRVWVCSASPPGLGSSDIHVI